MKNLKSGFRISSPYGLYVNFKALHPKTTPAKGKPIENGLKGQIALVLAENSRSVSNSAHFALIFVNWQIPRTNNLDKEEKLGVTFR